MNSLWRHLKLTNPLESAIPLGILQSNACSGQNKGITVTKQETAQKLFSTRKEWKPFRAEHPGTFWEALHSMDKTPFLSYSSSRERIPTAQRSSCQKSTPTFCPGWRVSSSNTSGSLLVDISYLEIRWEAAGLKSREQAPVLKPFCAILQNLTGCGKQG